MGSRLGVLPNRHGDASDRIDAAGVSSLIENDTHPRPLDPGAIYWRGIGTETVAKEATEPGCGGLARGTFGQSECLVPGYFSALPVWWAVATCSDP